MKTMRFAFGYHDGVGKDTACDYLVAKYGGVKLSFSTKLYDMMYEEQDRLEIPRHKDRHLLMKIAKDIRSVDDAYFANVVERQILTCQGNIFISDVRFMCEVEMLKRHGFTFVMIVNNQPVVNEYDLAHFAFDHVIINDSSLETFYGKIENVILEY